MDRDVKAAPEEQFGANLSKVRVHTGGNAPEIAKGLGAKAFTIGNGIYFAKPGDANDPEVLAHELAHVIQQGNGRMPKEKDGKALTSRSGGVAFLPGRGGLCGAVRAGSRRGHGGTVAKPGRREAVG
jgi:hypothetical protein